MAASLAAATLAKRATERLDTRSDSEASLPRVAKGLAIFGYSLAAALFKETIAASPAAATPARRATERLDTRSDSEASLPRVAKSLEILIIPSPWFSPFRLIDSTGDSQEDVMRVTK
jgi:hypothetical protein